MEYTNENYMLNTKSIFFKKESWTSRLINKIKIHKWISMLIITTILLSIVNFIMIYYFIQLLQTI